MLQDAGNVALMADTPWLLAPAVAIFVVVLSLNLLSGARAEHALFARIRDYFIPLVNSVHGCVFMSRSKPRAQPNCG